MLIYTPSGKEKVLEILEEARGFGKYSEEFRNALHQKLSYIHLREDKIHLSGGEFKAEVDYEKKTVKFSCEFYLQWETGTVGGLVWHSWNGSFGIHS